jgi:hypothetical protein
MPVGASHVSLQIQVKSGVNEIIFEKDVFFIGLDFFEAD